MNKNLKFTIWILAVAVFSATIGYLMPSKPWPPAPKAAVSVSVGRGTPAKQVSTAENPAAITAAAVTSGAASNGTQAQTPASAVSPADTPAALKSRTPVAASFFELKQILGNEPASVSRVVFTNGSNEIIVNRIGKVDLKVTVPDDGGKAELRRLLDDAKIAYEVRGEPTNWLGLFSNHIWLVIGIFVIGTLVFNYFTRQKANGGVAGRGPSTGNGANMGQTTAKMVDELGENAQKVTFDDVAGCDEAVKELKRVVKGFEKNVVYDIFDAKLPRGILLLGPPGTGKTLLAKAVAGECEGSMQILSGSDFVEMYVGVGAARVRDTFAKAREKVKATGKPHVIFIDEIDAVGGKRGTGAGAGGNQEREQTLNALLVEMDGVQSNKGIIVMAATNRADMLDDALLRPGRFDCHIAVDMPDVAGREKIFAIHTRKKPLAANVTPGLLAARSYGYSGAEIKGACDRAAMIAAERWGQLPGVSEALAKIAKADKLLAEAQGNMNYNPRKSIPEEKKAQEMKAAAEAELNALPAREILLKDFDEGIDFVRYGGPKTASQAAMAIEEKTNTAYHEAGHAVVAAVLKAADPVVKATIMRRSRALGYVQYMPTTDRMSFSDDQAVARIIIAMAGRAAQEVYLNKVDTGASNDFEQASDMARRMVTSWGMSRLGRISVGERGASPMGGMSGGGNLPYGGALSNEIDVEWRRITETCYQIARYIVETDKERMEHVAKTLLEQETILAPEWNAFLEQVPTKVDAEKICFKPAA